MEDFTGIENAKPCKVCHRCLTTNDICSYCQSLQDCRSGAAEMAKWLEANRVEINHLNAEIARLRAELAAAREDRERLEWLHSRQGGLLGRSTPSSHGVHGL
jgi:hypothetical protein